MRVIANKTAFTGAEVKDEKRFSRRGRLVLIVATVLLLLSLAQKTYRFTLPTEGWSSTTDFENDNPIFVKNLLEGESELQAGDKVVAVEGIPFTTLLEGSSKGQASYLNYEAGQTLPYTVLRDSQELDVNVPLYAGSSLGLGTILWQFFTSNGVTDLFLWLAVFVTLFIFWKRPNNLTAQLMLLQVTATLASSISWAVTPLSVAEILRPSIFIVASFFSHWIHLTLVQPLGLHIILSFPTPHPLLRKRWFLPLLYGLPFLVFVLGLNLVVPLETAFVVVALYNLLGLVFVLRMFFTKRNPVETAQARWFSFGYALVGLSTFIFGLSAAGLFPETVETISNYIPFNLLYLLCIAVALLRYRLFDIDLIINRTLVYGTLSLGVVGLYTGLVTGSSYLLQTQSNIAISLVAVAIILFLLRPSYQLLQRGANRFIPATSVQYSMAAASSTSTPISDAENVPTRENVKEKKNFRSAHWVLAFAVLLLLFSTFQKIYRLTLPTDGWSNTTDFESDEPILEKNLLNTSSELQAGDKVVAVGGVPILELQKQAVAGKTMLQESYKAGQSITYTVLRNGETLGLAVPLYPGSSLGVWQMLRKFFGGNHVASPMLWLGIALVVFLFWKRPHHLTAQLLFIQIIATLASGISWTITPLGVADSLSPLTFYTAGFFSHWIHLTLEQPLGLHIILSFPKPHPLLQRRWFLPLLYGFPTLVLVLALAGLEFVHPFLVVALYNLLGIIFVVWMFFKKWDAVSTAQVRWFGLGFVFSNLSTLLFGLSAVGIIPEQLLPVTEALPYNLLFLACASVAILRYRLFDIDIILNRTLVYGGLTAGIIGLYALVVGGVGRLVHVESNVLLSLLATGLVAVAFNPLRVRLQKTVNHLLYGDRDDPYQVLSKLSGQMEGTLEPSKLLPSMTETIANVLKLPYTAIALGQNGDMQIVASHGTLKGESVMLPLAYQGETVGELRLGLRAGEIFKPSELNLLKTIAQQTSVAAYTVKQNLDLQHSREALVTAREEERLRIRRDLHDGLGPELASLTLKLDATRNILKNDTNRAEELLVELKHQTQDAVASIRRLVYALRPPALDELGLEGALREQARSYDHTLNIQLNTVGDLTNLPAAVEVACYRITQEALTNVVRHSGAKHCTILLRVADKLFIDVQDDGVGIPEQYRAGVGLRSMRERAEELGGTFTIESSEKGTRLLATLPLLVETREEEVSI